MGNIPTENIDDLRAFILSIRKKVRDHYKEGDLATAVSLIELLAKDIEENVLPENDDETEYHDFTQMIEYLLYKHYNNNSEREINWIEIPGSHVFFDYGALLLDAKRYDESRAALLKSLYCNPANAMAYYEIAETYKASGNMCDDYVANIKKGFKYAYTPELFAKGIRSLGYYFSKKQQYDAALCCYELSKYYDPKSQMAQNEINYIAQKTGKQIETPSIDEIKACAEKYDFPVLPPSEILNCINSHLKFAIDQHTKSQSPNDYETVKYFTLLAGRLIFDDINHQPRLPKS